VITAPQILEAYFDLIKVDWLKEPSPIFINPDRSEMTEIGEWIKFIANAQKKEVYVWKLDRAQHGEVTKKFGLPSYKEKQMLAGIACRESGLYSIQFSDLLNNEDQTVLRDKLKRLNDWSWLGKYYFNMDQFVKDAHYYLPGLYRKR
jgi:hypothetical protein